MSEPLQGHPGAGIPVLFLTGFLGAGKTTLLSALLRNPKLAGRSLAVVVNEFGERGVDGVLLPEGNYVRYDLNKGSIFCICTKTDLLGLFTEIRETVRPDLVLVEAGGLAEPRDLGSILSIPALSAAFTTAGNVCLVDPLTFPKVRHTLKTVLVQVQQADLLAITKSDLVDAETIVALRHAVRELNATAPIVEVVEGDLDPQLLLDLRHPRDWAALPRETPPEGICSVSVELHDTMDLGRLYGLLRRWGDRCLRAKGWVPAADGRWFVEWAAGRLSSRRAAPNESPGDASPFVVIAREMDAEEIRAALLA